MVPDFGLFEMLVVGIVALVVVGPRDLPKLMRQVGKALGHVKGLAREFQKSFDEMGREAELDELRREIETLKNSNPATEVMRPLNEVRDEIEAAGADARAAGRDQG